MSYEEYGILQDFIDYKKITSITNKYTKSCKK